MTDLTDIKDRLDHNNGLLIELLQQVNQLGGAIQALVNSLRKQQEMQTLVARGVPLAGGVGSVAADAEIIRAPTTIEG